MNDLAHQSTPWTAAHETVLRSVWVDASKSSDDVAAALRRSWESCRVKAGFMKLGRRPSGVPTEKNKFWTAERVTILTEGLACGMSHSQIASKIGHGCTRGACIGKAHRLGLVAPRQPSKPTMRLTSSVRRAPPQPRPRVVVCGNNTTIAHMPRPALVPAPKADAWAALEGSTPRPFETRCLIECNWPIDDESGAPMLRCCLPVERGGYCATHHERGTAQRQPRDAKPGQLARSLRRYA